MKFDFTVALSAFLVVSGLGASQLTMASDQIANPAAEKCVNLGGTLENYHTASGEGGYCRFDYALIEEWTLFHSVDAEAGTQAAHAFLNHVEFDSHIGSESAGIAATPASRYCAQVGGAPLTVETAREDVAYMCQFQDHSIIEQWTLYLGPKGPECTRLAAILAKTPH